MARKKRPGLHLDVEVVPQRLKIEGLKYNVDIEGEPYILLLIPIKKLRLDALPPAKPQEPEE